MAKSKKAAKGKASKKNVEKKKKPRGRSNQDDLFPGVQLDPEDEKQLDKPAGGYIEALDQRMEWQKSEVENRNKLIDKMKELNIKQFTHRKTGVEISLKHKDAVDKLQIKHPANHESPPMRSLEISSSSTEDSAAEQ